MTRIALKGLLGPSNSEEYTYKWPKLPTQVHRQNAVAISSLHIMIIKLFCMVQMALRGPLHQIHSANNVSSPSLNSPGIESALDFKCLSHFSKGLYINSVEHHPFMMSPRDYYYWVSAKLCLVTLNPGNSWVCFTCLNEKQRLKEQSNVGLRKNLSVQTESWNPSSSKKKKIDESNKWEYSW